MKFSIPLFSGITPKIAAHLLPSDGATVAENCVLESGEIRPMAKSVLADKINQDGVVGLYRYVKGEAVYMLAWSVEIDVHKGFLAEDQYNRAYYTDDGGAKAWCEDDVDPGIFSPYKLGIPAPTAKPATNLTGTGSGDIYSTAYIFTLVSRHGEEGAPSPASDIIDVTPGQVVELSGLNTPIVAGYNTITKKRIYRLNTGTSGSTEYQFVAEIDVAATTYDDSVASADLAEVCPSEEWLVPPDGLFGLLAMQSMFFVGFKGRDVYASEPGYPHAFPLKYVNSTSFDIVGGGVSGNSAVILTDANAYVMDCTDITYAVPRRLDGSVPCVSRAGIVSTTQGVLYPSTDGLYMVNSASTAPENVSDGVFSKEDWEGFNPSTMRAFWYRNQYICFYVKKDGSKHGFIFELGKPARTLSVYAVAGHLEEEGNTLYLAFESDTMTEVVEWEAGDFVYTSEFRSKEFRTASPINIGAAIVEADYLPTMTEEEFEAYRQELLDKYSAIIASGDYGGDIGGSAVGEHVFGGDALDSIYVTYSEVPQVLFQLYANGELKFTAMVQDDEPFLCPDDYDAKHWVVVVAGDVRISGVHFAPSMQEVLSE